MLSYQAEEGTLIEINWRQALLQRMRVVLAEGKTLVVLGWRDSNHDPQTRQLNREGRVIFYHRVPSSLGSNVGFVISNKFIGHADFERIKVRKETHPVVISNGEIKRLLKACDDLLHPPVTTPPVVVTTLVLDETVEAPILTTPTVLPAVKTLTVLLDQGPKEALVTTQPIAEFIRLFKIEAKKNAGGFVSKNIVGEIRRAAGITATNSMLVTAGWLESVVSEGATNAGKYRASQKLLEYVIEDAPVEPNDPLMRARRLVAQKAAVEEQITLKKVELLEFEEKLKKIEAAETILGQLEALMK